MYMSLRNPNPSKLMQHAIIKEREFQIREKTMRFEVENIYFSLFGK